MNTPPSHRESLIYSLKIEEGKRAQKRRAWSKKKKFALLIFAIAFVLGLFFLNRFFKIPTVEVARAEVIQEGLPEIVLTAGGYIQADSTILVSSQINGKIKSLFVDEGSVVRKDQVLAEIEEDDYRAKYNLALADYKLAQVTLSRKESLYRAGVISRAEYDESVRTFKVRKESLESAKYFLENTKIRAPIEGTVIKKQKEIGEFLLPGITSEGVPGSAVLRIADLRVMNAELDILEADLSKIRVDQPAIVFPDALPERSYPAKVFYISPQADRQKSIVRVKVRLEKPDALLKPEMSARVNFLKEPARKEIVRRVKIPSSALIEQEGLSFVWVLQKENVVQKKVEVASRQKEFILVSQGIVGDEAVVLRPSSRLKEGMKVKVRAEGENK